MTNLLSLIKTIAQGPVIRLIIMVNNDEKLLRSGSGKTRHRRACRKRSLARLKELATTSSVVQQNVAPGVPASAFTMPVTPELGTEDSPCKSQIACVAVFV